MTQPSFTQLTFRIRDDDGNETGATWLALQGTDASIPMDTNVRVRFRIDETANRSWNNIPWTLYFSRNSGAYTAAGSGTAVVPTSSPNFTDGDDTTTQLTGGTGTFVTDNNGMDSTGVATNSGTAGDLFEVEYCFQINSAVCSVNDTIDLRVYNSTAAIAAYTDTPRLTATAGAQTLTPTSYSDGDTFGAATVEAESSDQTLTATLYPEGDSFGGGSVFVDQALTGTLYNDGDSFGSATLTGTTVAYVSYVAFFAPEVADESLQATILSDGDTFGAASLALNLEASLHADGDSFGTHTVTPGPVDLTATAITDGDNFGSHVVSVGAVTLTATLHSDGDNFGSHTVTPGEVTLSSTQYTDGDTFGSHVVSAGDITLVPALYQDTDTFGSHTVTPGATNLSALLFSKTGYALEFKGNGTDDIDRVKIPINRGSNANPADFGGNATIEVWIRPTSSNTAPAVTRGSGMNWVTGNIFVDRDTYGDGDYGDWGISLGNGRVAFGVGIGNSAFTLVGTTDLRDSLWHHVAVTRNTSTGAIAIYVDGVQEDSGTGPTGDMSYRDARSTSWPNDEYLVLGAEKHDIDPDTYQPFFGQMQDLRISDTVRYSSTFTPEKSFSNDSNTLGLWSFEDAEGTTLSDAATQTGSPTDGTVSFGGSPYGPEWVGSTLVADTIYEPSIEVGSINLQASSAVVSTNTFGSHTVTPGEVNLSATVFTDGENFGSHAITTGIDLSATLHVDGDTFGEHALHLNLEVERYQNSNSFGAASVTSDTNLAASLVEDGDTFGTHYVYDDTLTLFTNHYQDGDTFGEPTVSPQAVTVTATLLVNTNEFGEPIVSAGAISLSATLHEDGDTFGEPTVVVGEVTLNVTSIASTTSFGSHTVTPGAVSLTAPEVESINLFGNPQVSVVIAPSIYEDGDTFGTPVITSLPPTLAPPIVVSTTVFHGGQVIGGAAPPNLIAVRIEFSYIYGQDIEFNPVIGDVAIFDLQDEFNVYYIDTNEPESAFDLVDEVNTQI